MNTLIIGRLESKADVIKAKITNESKINSLSSTFTFKISQDDSEGGPESSK